MSRSPSGYVGFTAVDRTVTAPAVWGDHRQALPAFGRSWVKQRQNRFAAGVTAGEITRVPAALGFVDPESVIRFGYVIYEMYVGLAAGPSARRGCRSRP